VINIQGTRGMIIGQVNSTRVKHFVGTKLLRNTGNVSSAVTHNTMEVPGSQQNGTQSKRCKVNVPPDPAALFDTWPDGPPPTVGAPLYYCSMLAPDSLPQTGSRRVTIDEATISHPQGQGGRMQSQHHCTRPRHQHFLSQYPHTLSPSQKSIAIHMLHKTPFNCV